MKLKGVELNIDYDFYCYFKPAKRFYDILYYIISKRIILVKNHDFQSEQ